MIKIQNYKSSTINKPYPTIPYPNNFRLSHTFSISFKNKLVRILTNSKNTQKNHKIQNSNNFSLPLII